MADMVTLEVAFVESSWDDTADLLWVAQTGEETRYAEVTLGATVQQETFPGHHWVLRGKMSGKVLLDIIAEGTPAVQRHSVDRQSAARLDQPVQVSASRADGDASHAAPTEVVELVEAEQAEADPAVAALAEAASSTGAEVGGGVWISTEVGETHRFEQLSRRVNGEVGGSHLGSPYILFLFPSCLNPIIASRSVSSRPILP